MAKLKFDRILNVVLTDNEQTEVPKDEVWKGTRSGLDNINEIAVNAGLGYGKVHDSVMLGGVLKSLVEGLFQGLPLRLYNKLAKGVSLA